MAAAIDDLVVEQYLQAAYSEGQHVGSLLCEWLDEFFAQIRRKNREFQPPSLPIGFLMEAAALSQLRDWERQGLRPLLPADLPEYAEAYPWVLKRARDNPHQFLNPANAVLWTYVAGISRQHFAAAGRTIFDADIVCGTVDEDALVDALAQLLWTHRHDAINQGEKAGIPDRGNGRCLDKGGGREAAGGGIHSP
jgi:hypothetical protein